jgi:hypothetical protein
VFQRAARDYPNPIISVQHQLLMHELMLPCLPAALPPQRVPADDPVRAFLFRSHTPSLTRQCSLLVLDVGELIMCPLLLLRCGFIGSASHIQCVAKASSRLPNLLCCRRKLIFVTSKSLPSPLYLLHFESPPFYGLGCIPTTFIPQNSSAVFSRIFHL